MNGEFKSPSHREWWSAGLITLLVVGMLMIPYVLAYLAAQEGWEFTGTLMNPEDSQSYFAKMLQGYDGAFLYNIPFTPEKHSAAFLGVFYLWLGHLARILRVSLPFMWHLSRAAAGAFMFMVTFGFVASYLRSSEARRTAFLLAIFGSGLGWVLFLLNQPYWLGSFPVDFKQPGAHLFFSALTFPHVGLGTALTMISVWFLQRISAAGIGHGLPWMKVLAAGITNLAIVIIYPFLIYLIAAVALLYWAFQVWLARRLLWQMGLAFLATFALAMPLIIYYAYTLGSNVVFRTWDAQALTPALPAPHYLIAYGPMLLLAGLFWRAKPELRLHFALPWIWILAAAALLYAPLRPQRRFVQGVHVPLAILASTAFLTTVLPWLESTPIWRKIVAYPRYTAKSLRRFMTTLFLLFMSLSNFYVLASVSVSAVVQQPDTIFRPIDEIEMSRWLRREIRQPSIVLGDYISGNYVAAHSGHRVVIGHWAETLDYEAKLKTVAVFFDASTDDQFRKDLLSRFDVDYVWFGPRERELGGFMPDAAGYLKPVHTIGDITLFAFIND